MTDILIREATKEDIPAIAAVHVSGWRSSYRGIVADDFLDSISPEGFATLNHKHYFSDTSLTYVAETTADDRIIGFCSGGTKDGPRKDFASEIYAFYVLEEFRSHGIGKKLLHKVVTKLTRSGLASLIIWTFKDNPYRRLYESLKGNVVRNSTLELEGKTYETVAYGWYDSRNLLRAAR